MNRRDSIKAIGLTALSTGLLGVACKDTQTESTETQALEAQPGRELFEVERDAKLLKLKFFNAHEMQTLTVLVDIIIPKDEVSASATEAKVPEFIDFIVNDMPDYQLPMRGGLKWLDLESAKRFEEKPFIALTAAQQIEIVDDIAYPDKAPSHLKPGVKFFNTLRYLTASGFYTTEMGVKDIGYVGNTPNQWPGVPQEVLKQYGLEDVKI